MPEKSSNALQGEMNVFIKFHYNSSNSPRDIFLETTQVNDAIRKARDHQSQWESRSGNHEYTKVGIIFV